MINCQHWKDCGMSSGGECTKGRFGGRPSAGVCVACPHRVPTQDGRPARLPQKTNPEGSRRISPVGVAGVAKAVASTIKTTLGIDRLPTEDYLARLNVCRACPGGHAKFRPDGSLYTCGQLLRQSRSTCGCIVAAKARDRAQHCPNGWWPGDDAERRGGDVS
jgi:hypothetical protein